MAYLEVKCIIEYYHKEGIKKKYDIHLLLLKCIKDINDLRVQGGAKCLKQYQKLRTKITTVNASLFLKKLKLNIYVAYLGYDYTIDIFIL